ncbi:hypothetical protein [Pelagibacterium sp. H642]|uniref:spike base protein, RCAP_Rcc01079 family n=1 Tax=Pelagibacterium sp. H642 TaxID=1881069 RepID=UPI0028155AE4|nr:hypothetical protein [Pelagibacterium sp. H642]WMT89096.1 hypothetical protein NO934_09680 [Pelagibacterium sp. H642]
MTADFSGRASSASGPAGDFFAITPDDFNDLPQVTRAIYVGSAGNLAVVSAWGREVRFANVAGGTVLPVCAARIMASGTDAGDLVGLV